MIIRVHKRNGTEEGESATELEVEIVGIDPLRVIPIREKVGSLLSIQELTELLGQIQPLEPLKLEEPESYYAQGIAAWQDSSLSCNSIDIPHHIGLRVAVASIVEKYGMTEYLVEIG